MKVRFRRIDYQGTIDRRSKTSDKRRKSIGNSVSNVGGTGPAGCGAGLYLEKHLACAGYGQSVKLHARKQIRRPCVYLMTEGSRNLNVPKTAGWRYRIVTFLVKPPSSELPDRPHVTDRVIGVLGDRKKVRIDLT